MDAPIGTEGEIPPYLVGSPSHHSHVQMVRSQAEAEPWRTQMRQFDDQQEMTRDADGALDDLNMIPSIENVTASAEERQWNQPQVMTNNSHTVPNDLNMMASDEMTSTNERNPYSSDENLSLTPSDETVYTTGNAPVANMLPSYPWSAGAEVNQPLNSPAAVQGGEEAAEEDDEMDSDRWGSSAESSVIGGDYV